MAHKGQKEIHNDPDLRREILGHVHALHMREIDDYQAWCVANGFNPSLKKSASQRDNEVRAYQLLAVKQRLKAHNQERNIRRQLRTIIATEVKPISADNGLLHQIRARLQQSPQRQLLSEAFTYLETKTDFLKDAAYVRGIDYLVTHSCSWIHPLAMWTPKTHNTARQFASLARHLLARYPVPAFMDSAWLSGNDKQQKWFIHIGQGGNIRTAPSLPLALTKKMAHCFMQAPEHLTAKGALRWAQIIALGGSRQLAQAINETRLARSFKDNEFWETVLQFFIRHPMLDVMHVNPIVDYIWNQKYEDRGGHLVDGVVRQNRPVQPNFTMRGRTADSLLRQVEQWHGRMGRESSAGDLYWRRALIGEFKYIEGAPKSGNQKLWTIRELLSSRELIAEGRQQRHCVASYARSCFKRTISIWTMELAELNGVSKRLTIELSLPSKTIYQVRGRRNRLADGKERDVIRRWAQQEGLKGTDFL